MTPQQREAALRLADYWEADSWPGGLSGKKMDETAALLRELAAAPQGEPVAWFLGEPGNYREVEHWAEGAFPVYAHPPQRQPLSDEQIDKLLDAERMKWTARTGPPTHEFAAAFARAIERAIGETP